MTRNDAEIENLRLQVRDLKAEVRQLREFVKSLYALLNEDEEYQPADYAGGARAVPGSGPTVMAMATIGLTSRTTTRAGSSSEG